MANRYYDNSDGAQRFQPGTTARADEVDAKLDQVATGFEQAEQDIDRSLKLPASETSQEINATPLQRRRRVVGFDADGNLTLLTGFNWRDDWATATEYFVNDVFRDPATKNIYVTVTRHTSAAALSTDITAGRAELAINVEDVEAAKTAAQAAASTATTKAGEAASSAQSASEDATQTSEDRVQTGEDRVATGQDRTQTGQDRAQTGQDRSAAANSAQAASESEAKSQQWAESEDEVEPGSRSAKYWAGQAAQAVSDGVIDDSQKSLDFTWSSEKVGEELARISKVGQSQLFASSLTTNGFLPMDGSRYLNSAYPELSALMPKVQFPDVIVSGTPTLQDTGTGVYADENYIYAVNINQPGFRVIDKEDFSFVSGTPSLSSCRAVHADSDRVYVLSTLSPYLHVYNKSDWSLVPGTPTLPGSGWAIFVDDSYIYCSHRNAPYFTVIDKTDLSVVSGTPAPTDYGNSVYADADYVYIAYRAAPYLMVIDKSDWSVVPGTPAINSIALGVYADSKNIYVAHVTAPSFTVIDKADFSVVPGTPALDSQGRSVYADDNYIYVGGFTAPYFTVINKTDFSVVPGTPALTGYADGVYADDDYVYAVHATPPYLTVMSYGDGDSFRIPVYAAPNSFEWRVKAEDV